MPAREATPLKHRLRVDESGLFPPLVGEDHDLVRPYIALYEREQKQQQEERHMRALRIPLLGAAAEAAR